MKLIGCESLHPVCESLIEPEVIPPLHCHQVSKPLVRKLMRDDCADALLLRRRHSRCIAKESDLTVCHQTPVFHCTGGEVRNCNHVHLWQGIWDPEEVVVEVERTEAASQSIAAHGGLARAAKDPGQGAAAGLSTHEFKLADAEGEEIGAHLRRWQEGLSLHASLRHLELAGRHVGEGREVRRVDQGHSEGGLPCGLVPAGKATTGVDGLKLRGGHVPRFALGIRVLGAIEASHLVVEHPAEGHFELTLSNRQDLLEAE
mmetsp:Transcript_2871/g.6742  ORF Transcript_2871/g.6742 Transcript_2871/m.6742 type:complete len:259 (-) Transcript_2871:312-1088(-)